MGVLSQIANALVVEDRQPDMKRLQAIYPEVTRALPDILKKRGPRSCYEAAVFRDPATSGLAAS